MDGRDYLKLRALIDDLSSKHRKTTEAEVLWVLDVAKQAKNCKQTVKRTSNYETVTTPLMEAGTLSESTRAKVYTFCRELIAFRCNASDKDCEGGTLTDGAPKDAAYILGAVGDAQAVSMLVPLLDHRFFRTREEAANALRKMKARGVPVPANLNIGDHNGFDPKGDYDGMRPLTGKTAEQMYQEYVRDATQKNP